MKVLLAIALVGVACAGTAETIPAGGDGAPPPTEPAALDQWFASGEHRQWERWSQVGPTLGSGGARVFLSASLAESLLTQSHRHPAGAAAVRELYADDFATLTGYAILVKIAEPGEADSWYCFERLNMNPEAEAHVTEPGAAGCSGCHRQGKDFVHSTLPLP
jgi:hypothetical protein